jgi:hypothetical protein
LIEIEEFKNYQKELKDKNSQNTVEAKKLNESYAARIGSLESSMEMLDIENITLTSNFEHCQEKLLDTTNEKEDLNNFVQLYDTQR